jgi:DNA-binding NtrC family response regulator
MPQFLIHRGSSYYREYQFSNAECLLIGRTRANDIYLPDPGRRVSRSHAAVVRLARGSERYFIRDLGSLRGVRVGGMPVFQHVLAEGDVVEIADFELIYSAREPSAEEFSPLRVVSHNQAENSEHQGTKCLTGFPEDRSREFDEPEEEVFDTLLQAARQRITGNKLLAEMLPAIARVSGSRSGFVGLFRSQVRGSFSVLCRTGMSPGDQIEISDSGFADSLLAGQPLLEGRTMLAPVFDRDQVVGLLGLERPISGVAFTSSEAGFVIMAARMTLARDYGSVGESATRSELDSLMEWPSELIGLSAPIRELRSQIEEAALSDTNVLLQGESGSGKEVVARAFHAASRYASGPFVARNCATITESLADAEIFGHAPRSGIAGADTAGAPGWFELAAEGTLFLDEIHGLDLPLQDKFLRVLQEKEVLRVRGRRGIPVNAQVIAATDHLLEQCVSDGSFRAPLYYRFGKQIRVPALRERIEDIFLLTFYFLDRYAYRLGSPVRTISHKALNSIRNYAWPGNVRELENCIKTAVAKVRDRAIVLSFDLPETIEATSHNRVNAKGRDAREADNTEDGPQPMAVVEKAKIMEALDSVAGNVTLAARLLGYRSRQTMLNKMDRYRIPRNFGDPDRAGKEQDGQAR